MERADKGLTSREAVLLALDSAGGTVEGRTAMQKILYFASLALDADFGHRAHYYGPYSRPVEQALTQSALAEDVSETMDRFSTYTSGPDLRKYTYQLTPQGKEEVEAALASYPEEAAVIRQTVEAVHAAVPDLDQKTLSMAAKIHFIVSQQENPTPLDRIPSLARELGWRISSIQVTKSVELLRSLELLTVN